MIKTAVKLLIVLAILNAVGRAGLAAWNYYQLRDEAQQLVVFGAGMPIGDLHRRILQKASELEIPLLPENLSVRRDGHRTFVDAAYTQPVELFPNYTYPVSLSFSVDAFAMNPITADEVTR